MQLQGKPESHFSTSGIIHRDLKPENIFIVPDPVAPLGERVKLLDFGIAKVLDGKARKTTVGMILGTPLYMSPEQCEGSEDLDDKVDVYALGVLMYEMICGHLPFSADTAAALMRQHMFKEPPPLDEQVLDLPPDLCTVVHHMLAKAPDERPTMVEVGAMLEALLPKLGVQASGQHAIIPVPNTGRRRQIAIGGDEKAPDPFASTMGGAPVRVTPSAMASTMAGEGEAVNRDSNISLRISKVGVRDSKDGVLSSKDGVLSSKDGVLSSKDGDRESKLEQVSVPQPVDIVAVTPPVRSRKPLIVGGALVLAIGIGLFALRKPSVHPPIATTQTTNPITPHATPTPPPPNPPENTPQPGTDKPAMSPPPNPNATANANPNTEGDGDDMMKDGKGKAKKPKSRKKSKAEEIDSVINKKAASHSHSVSDGETDVWR